jgi:hypothetical protein
MKRNHMSAALDAWFDCARALFDIFCIGATAFEDRSPEADVRNLESDLHRIGGDFWNVLSGVESGDLQ